jgi:hypothetical protein
MNPASGYFVGQPQLDPGPVGWGFDKNSGASRHLWRDEQVNGEDTLTNGHDDGLRWVTMTDTAVRPMAGSGTPQDINRAVPIPYYYQLEGLIRGQVASGQWLPGQRVPSEKQLGDIYAVSRTTVRQAVNNLVARGLLYHVKGKGTFVCRPPA